MSATSTTTSTIIDASTVTGSGETKMTAEERRLFDKERAGFFKGTIAVMVIYGVFILVMSLVGILTPKGKEFLFVNGFGFTVTFIAGTILIILLLLVQILTYKRPQKTVFAGEDITCPDYWELKKTPQSVLDKIPNERAKALSAYYCENPADSIATDMKLPTGDTRDEVKKLKETLDTYNNISTASGNYHMQCNRMFPEYMGYMDKTYFPANPTVMRCEYLKQCANATTQGSNNDRKINWSGVCPEGV